jgi:hypothetical protein
MAVSNEQLLEQPQLELRMCPSCLRFAPLSHTDILHLDSLACQESALHGLGHWQPEHEEKVAAIIDDFCEAYRETDPRLLVYAKSARCGCVT